MTDIADYANTLPPSSRLGSVADMLSEEDLPSPVDMFRRSIIQILQYGTEPRLEENGFIGRLLALGVVAAAEAYFRAVLSACIELCPVAQSGAASKQINLGGLLWHGKEGFSRSAFEHASFASGDELIRACKDYLSIKLEDSKFKILLNEYERVCLIRHGIVHADGLLPGRNAVQLDVPRYAKPVRIVIRYAQLQDIAAVINTLVLTLNRELFVKMCERWAINWRTRADWDPALERTTFRRLWTTFHSADEITASGRSKITNTKCMAEVKAQYGI
ncbi:hypothetical protein [Acidocella sp.]|uniref:hypothetical protein n=1 Tax=Acidocella sp. TaxID=50710 RepID=UPI0017B43917|nr:hypothetical protein [Acidocella sp.]NNM56492.1 hypothetical protein [Acidocella sp.]